MLERYLGPDHSSWDPRVRHYLKSAPEARCLRVTPTSLIANDLSLVSSSAH
jgi:hypothetical protein